MDVKASNLWNCIEVLNFLALYIRNCINCVYNCEDHSLLDTLSMLSKLKYVTEFCFFGEALVQHKINTLPAGKRPEIKVVWSFVLQLLRSQSEIQGVRNVRRCHPRRVRTAWSLSLSNFVSTAWTASLTGTVVNSPETSY